MDKNEPESIFRSEDLQTSTPSLPSRASVEEFALQQPVLRHLECDINLLFFVFLCLRVR